MRVRIPFRSSTQDDASIGSAPDEGGQSQSVEWVFAHLHLDHPLDDAYDADEAEEFIERRSSRFYWVALAVVIVVAVGAGGLLTLSGLKTHSAAEGSGADRALAGAPARQETAQTAGIPSQPAPLPSLSAPEMIQLPALAAPDTVLASRQTTMPSPLATPAAPGALSPSPATSGPGLPASSVSPGQAITNGGQSTQTVGQAPLKTQAAFTALSHPPQPMDAMLPPYPAAPSPAPISPAPTKLAAIAPRVLPASGGRPFNIRLSFTADQSDRAAAFAGQLRREGFKVTSTLVPVIHGRWPGVAFFFNSDRDKARLVARQLASVTGQKEHARLSSRHPYPKSGTVEVALLRTTTSSGRTSGNPAHTHHLP